MRLDKKGYSFPKKAADSLIKVKNGIFVSRHDPSMIRKQWLYHPTDPDKLYAYANQLAAEQDPDAVYFYKKAAQYGHLPSMGKLKELQQQSNVVQSKPAEKALRPHPYRDPLLIGIIMLLLLLAAFLFLYAFLYDKLLFQKNEYHYHYQTVPAAVEDPPLSLTDYNPPKPYTSRQLLNVALMNAIENYHDAKGTYPAALDELAGENPNNWISFLVDGYNYKKRENGYSLFVTGAEKPLEASARIILQFYPDTSQLGVFYGRQLLALYPVASGADAHDIPFQDSLVVHRVVKPNGGDGVLGTRGLELAGNYAIHGTSDPASIGEKVTLGCIRMFNEDIESLYPYIPTGTTFKVVKGAPEQRPLFPDGLPPVENPIPSAKEETSDVVYHWNG